MGKVFVRFSGRKFLVSYKPGDTVSKIKSVVQRRYSCEELSLTYDGKLLDCAKVIEHYGIDNMTTIEAFVPVKGGIPITDVGLAPLKASEIAQSAIQFSARFGQEAGKIVADRADKLKKSIFEKLKQIEIIRKAVHAIQTIMRFFPIIYLVLIILAFFGKPLEYVMLFIAMLFVCIIYVIYAILNLPPFIFVPMVIWFIIRDILPLILYCMIFAALLIVILLFCLILSIVNAMTGGALKNIVLCQNSPAAWYKTPNFHFDNRYERGLFCSRPCFPRYQPDTTGMNCTKLPAGYPGFCPQAEAMRLYTGTRKDRVYMYKDYKIVGNIKYLKNDPLAREGILKNHYLRKAKFMNVCDEKMRDYDPVALAICSATEMIPNDKGNPLTKNMSSKDIKKLRNVCRQGFCNSRKNYPFCTFIGASDDDDESMIVKKVIKITIMIIVFVFVVLFCIKYMCSMTHT